MTRMRPAHAIPRRLAALARRVSWPERVAVAVVLAAAGFGFAEVGAGLYIKLKGQVAQVLLERAWMRARAGEAEAKPWPWADTWPVARLTVPRIGRSAVVLAGTSGEAMAFAPGHMTGTPLPGMPGVGVISGHRDTHFGFLREIVGGDLVTISTADGSDHTYRVTGTSVVHANASGIDPGAPGRGIALVTCYPFDAYGRGPERFVVHADELAAPEIASVQLEPQGIGDPFRLPEVLDRDVLAVAQPQLEAAGAEQSAEH
jgi:sortase A